MKVKVIHKTGRKPIHFNEGGLHESLGVSKDKTIPKSLVAAAKSGKYGDKAEKQAMFMQNVLKK